MPCDRQIMNTSGGTQGHARSWSGPGEPGPTGSRVRGFGPVDPRSGRQAERDEERRSDGSTTAERRELGRLREERVFLAEATAFTPEARKPTNAAGGRRLGELRQRGQSRGSRGPHGGPEHATRSRAPTPDPRTAQEQQPETHAGRQTRTTDPLRVELRTRGLDELVVPADSRMPFKRSWNGCPEPLGRSEPTPGKAPELHYDTSCPWPWEHSTTSAGLRQDRLSPRVGRTRRVRWGIASTCRYAAKADRRLCRCPMRWTRQCGVPESLSTRGCRPGRGCRRSCGPWESE